MNEEIKKILNLIEKEGYEAYIVGGYVRDYLLNRESYDVDICTNAVPKVLHEIFNVSIGDYGNCNIKINKYNIDITTYRKEIRYVGRKPIEINYINNLIEDLKRRDFTINSICMNQNGDIIDLLNGKDDLYLRYIKLIGNPDKKLQEDPLRILRAVRFASTLNFKIDDLLFENLKKYSLLVKSLSTNKIRLELNKILLSKNYIYGLKLLKDLNILNLLNIKYEKILYSDDLLAMWAQTSCEEIYFSKSEINTIKKMKEILVYGKIDKDILYEYGLYLSVTIGNLLGYKRQEINEIHNGMGVNEYTPLDISSEEIMDILNISGKDIKLIKSKIIELILCDKLENKNEKIKEYLSNKE